MIDFDVKLKIINSAIGEKFMNTEIREEIANRIDILIEQGLLTDLDVKQMAMDGKLCVSCPMTLFGDLIGIVNPSDINPSIEEKLNKGINDMDYLNVIPYFSMLMDTPYGELLTILYIDPDKETWEMEKSQLKEKNPCAFVYNLTDEQGEVGFIKYEMFSGGPIRTE